MVTILDKTIPNELTELTVQQFEDITTIHADKELDVIEKHLKVFSLFGFTEDDFEDTSIEDFKMYVKQFNTLNNKIKIKKSIIIDGFKYTGFPGKQFILSVKDTKFIEKILNTKNRGYISEVLSVLFKRDDLTKTEHYAAAHIKHKAKLIKELKADIAIPYIVQISKKLSKSIKIQDETTSVMEGN